jgi:hypothetical protein
MKFDALVEQILQPQKNNLIVIFSGRFQPFHVGHKKLYDAAKQKFPGADFYIATADTTENSAKEPDRYPFNFIEKNSVYQIYMNPSGLDLYNFLKKNGYTSNARLFYNFQVSPKKETRDLDIVTPECSYPGDKKITNLNYYPLDYYDGSKSFESSSRLQIWKFSETINKGEHGKLDNYSWKCDSKNYLSFQKLIRRLDNKAIPSSILMINPILQDSNLSNLSNDYHAWSDFWMRKGTTAIYFLDKLENDSVTSEVLQTFAKAYPNSTELVHIQEYLSTNSREIIVLSREPK